MCLTVFSTVFSPLVSVPLFSSVVVVVVVVFVDVVVMTKAPVHDPRRAEPSGRWTGRGGRHGLRVAQQVEGQGRVPLGLGQVREANSMRFPPIPGLGRPTPL